MRILIVNFALLGSLLLPLGSSAQERLIIKDVSSAKADKQQAEQKQAATSGEISALGQAAIDGDLLRIVKLLAAGAKVDEQDTKGTTALKRAVLAGQIASAQVLSENGANVNLRDSSGLTPLVYAVRQKSVAMVSLLLGEGADANVKDELGATPLIFAIQEGDLAIAHELLTGGAFVDAVDKNGLSALMYASLSDDISAVSLLMSQGADANLQTPAGKTAKDLAKPTGRIQHLSLLGSEQEQQAALSGALTTKTTTTAEQTKVEDSGPRLTRLRSIGRPEGVWESGKKGLRLKSAQVEVRNVGSETAENISVFVVVPGGKRIKASGPSTMERNARAMYLTGSIDVLATKNGKLKADMRCNNCR